MFDKIIIVDQSIVPFTPVAVESPDQPQAFFPIFSDQGFGKDEVIKLVQANNHGSLIDNFGTPGPISTLTPLYYAYEFVRGGGNAYIRRITSATSAHAHSIIVAKIRKGATGTPNDGKLEVKFEVAVLQDAFDLNKMVDDAANLLDIVPDADGYTTYPISIIGLNWTGSKGNEYTWRQLPNPTLDKQIKTAKTYNLESKANATASPKNQGFSLDTNAIIDGQSIFADDIFDEHSTNIFYYVLNTYEQFLKEISEFIPISEQNAPDIFFGKTKTNVPYPNYVILDTSVDFTNPGGIAFANGSDGTFAAGTPNRESLMMDRFVESFTEMPTEMLRNEYKYWIDFVFDFKDSTQTVKDTIVAFALGRKSTQAIIDTGVDKNTVASCIAARKSGGITYSNKDVTIVCGSATYRDAWSNKKMVMPLSFFEAFAIPYHVNTYEGGARPFAGALYTYDNMISGTYQPVIFDEESDEFKDMYDAQLNFAMEDRTGYQAAHQNTSSTVVSLGLGERSNIYLLNRMIRSCLLEAKAERWNFNEDDNVKQYGERIQQRLEIENNGKVAELKIDVHRAGDYGIDRNRVNATITVRFKYINKGTTFTFVVV